MRRAVILEDEPPARARLEAALQRADPGVRVAAALASVREAIAWFRENPGPELVFADIQLSDGLSLEIFDHVEIACPIVFCTAYDEYLIQAMAAGGIEYLLKPIRDADVAGALAKYDRLEAHFGDRRRALARALGGRRRILARRGDRFVAVTVEQIAYFAVTDQITELVTRDGDRLGVDRPLAELQAELHGPDFFRVNRQYLAHADAVASFQPFIKGRLLVELEPRPDGDVIVSQENAARFRAWLDR